MVSLEKIVRPFETRVLTPASPVVDPTKTPPKNIILQYGKGGGGVQTTSGHFDLSVTYYMTKQWNEFMTRDPSGFDPFAPVPIPLG